MTSTPAKPQHEPPPDAGPAEIEEHIAQTRHELAGTVQELTHKLDVKAQSQQKIAAAQQKSAELAERAKHTVRRPVALAAVGGTAAVAVAGVVAWRHKR